MDELFRFVAVRSVQTGETTGELDPGTHVDLLLTNPVSDAAVQQLNANFMPYESVLDEMSSWLASKLDERDPADVRTFLAARPVNGTAMASANIGPVSKMAAAKLILMLKGKVGGSASARHYRRVLLLDLIAKLPGIADAKAVKTFLAFAVKHVPLTLLGLPHDALSRQPAIGDLLQVRKQFLRVERGDYSYIENVMKGETRERVHEVHDESERFTTETEESETTTEKDLQVSDDSRLQTEASQVAKDDLKVQAGTNITASYGPFVQASVSAAFDYSQSRESSNRSSMEISRRVTDRAARKVREARSRTTSLRILSESTEKNLHRFVGGEAHTVGVYRFVDKVYKAQLVNYGKRLLLEFLVPEPAASLIAAVKSRRAKAAGNVGLTPPTVPGGANTFDRTSYQQYAASNFVENIAAPPAQVIGVGCSVNVEEQKGQWWKHGDPTEIVANYFVASKEPATVPDGYVAKSWKGSTASWVYERVSNDAQLWVGVGGSWSATSTATGPGDMAGGVLGDLTGKIPVWVATDSVRGFTVGVEITCHLTAEAEEKWKNTVYQAAMASYNARKAAYEAAVRQAAADGDREYAFWRGPEAKNRMIEQRELKRQVLELLLGPSFPRTGAAPLGASANAPFTQIDLAVVARERARIEFLEQGFEWIHLVYTLYPYFWGRSSEWENMVFSEATDPEFENFMQAGYARVVLPVRRNFEQALLLFLATGIIWEGGQAPQVGDPLYVAAAQEMLDADRATESEASQIGESWEVRIPTNLVALDDAPLFPPV